MAYPVDLLNLRQDNFVLWTPGRDFGDSPPQLVLRAANDPKPASIDQLRRIPLERSGKPDLWQLRATAVSPSLQDGLVYHYWFEVLDDSPEGTSRGKMCLTDPFAFTVDYDDVWDGGDKEVQQPASVIKYRGGKLWQSDRDGTEPQNARGPSLASLSANNHLVVYELPTSWSKEGTNPRGVDVDVGTFADVKALFDSSSKGDRFASIAAVREEAILRDLGINALELLPVSDAKTTDEWGYAPAHYFAPDFDLGSTSDLVSLVDTIHDQGTRFFTDVVMAFGHDPYRYLDFSQFHLRPQDERNNPDSYQSHSTSGTLREGWGGESWRYVQTTNTYDPETGGIADVHPAWSFHRAHLARWMADFAVDGLRLDSVNNIGNWDFVRDYRSRAWNLYSARYNHSGSGGADPSKFIVIGEELSMPAEMVHTGCLDALWNEPWQGRLRALLLGEASGGDDFEWTVRKVANCLLDDLRPGGFTDGSQAVNYITSHDIEGYRKERLFDFLQGNGVWDVERRAKLAFVLLLTAVGVPMIFAGEEFADKMDRSKDMGLKQTDPVNYGRKNDGGWRQGLFAYVAGLVDFRKRCPALGVDDTEFFHVDGSRGGRIMAWRRGGQGASPVVVVVNFTDEDTPGTEYVVPNWPEREAAGWREVTQGRDVPAEWVGREPLMAWEAKVYTYWR